MAKNILDVYVKMPSGKNVQFDMEYCQTIEALSNLVALKEDVNPKQIQLKYQGKILNPSSTLNYLGVRPETILKAEILESRKITLRCKLNEDETEDIHIDTLDTTTDLFRRIQNITTFVNKTIQTRGGVNVLNSGKKLKEVGLSDGDVLIVKELASPTPTLSDAPQSSADNFQLMDIKSSFDAQGRNVEVAFSFDTTGSMYSYLNTVRTKLKATCERLLKDIPNIRISLIAHGDYCDQDSSYVIKMVDFTSDVNRLMKFAKDVPGSGGGDTPECYEWVLRKAQTLDWAEDSAKALVVIGDSPPHGVGYTDQQINWHQELELLTGMGVKVYGVHAGGSTVSRPFYEELADRSGGCYIPLQHFDAITDMFLAVCYREASDDQLGEFVQEIEDAGEMTEAKKEMFKRLEETSKEDKDKEKKPERRDIRYSWWNNGTATENLQYLYNEQTDVWSSQRSTRTIPRTKKIRQSFRKKLDRKSCVLM
ncbi:uncharacterized protein LOC126819361 [Patella vulgata]|uniref:uncharacterized protein LOC126819361 n=1 Tax=Patella vulgata TaxID=6465 RepID=UPI00218046F9|nr:uncharacterized protein LOC126819361 [Patella vulgata]